MKSIRRALQRKPRPDLLRALASYVEKKVHPHRLDMNNFCGTARCAFGHAPSVPAIGRTGLRYAKGIFGSSPRLREKDEAALRTVNGDTYPDNFERIQFVFGVTKKEAESVFIHRGHFLNPETPAQVAHRIRKLASRYDGKPA